MLTVNHSYAEYHNHDPVDLLKSALYRLSPFGNVLRLRRWNRVQIRTDDVDEVASGVEEVRRHDLIALVTLRHVRHDELDHVFEKAVDVIVQRLVARKLVDDSLPVKGFN